MNGVKILLFTDRSTRVYRSFAATCINVEILL